MEVEINLAVPRGASVTCSSFNENGFTLATGTSIGTVEMFDMRHIDKRLSALNFADNPVGKPTPVNRCCFDKFGSHIAIATHNVKLWNWKDGKELAVLSSHMGPVTGVSWGSEASWLASSSIDKSARIYGKIY
jgi:pre-mRNA-processing factor 19